MESFPFSNNEHISDFRSWKEDEIMKLEARTDSKYGPPNLNDAGDLHSSNINIRRVNLMGLKPLFINKMSIHFKYLYVLVFNYRTQYRAHWKSAKNKVAAYQTFVELHPMIVRTRLLRMIVIIQPNGNLAPATSTTLKNAISKTTDHLIQSVLWNI